MTREPKVDMTLRTRVGHAAEDDARFRGYSVMHELAGQTSFVELAALAVAGRRLSREGAAVLDDIATVITTPDPRIWPIKIVRLVSAYGRVMPAISCSQVWQESARMPFWECGAGAELLREIEVAVQGDSDEVHLLEAAQRALQRREHPAGFHVVLRNWDVRLTTLGGCLRKRGDRHLYRYWRLLERLRQVSPRLGLIPSVSLGISAACLDLGFEPSQIAPLATTLVTNCLLANAVEGAQQQPQVLRELPASAVRYVGTPARKSPRARATSPDEP